MNLPKRFIAISSVGFGLAGIAIAPPWTSPPASAQSQVIIEYIEPSYADRGRPGNRGRGGGSRDGNCEWTGSETALTALVPVHGAVPETAQAFSETNNNPAELAVWSLTTQANPSLWFYVPFQLEGTLPLKFVLNDESGNTVYQTEITPEVTGPGVLSVVTPELAIGASYQWFLIPQCTGEAALSRPNPFVDGWIERIDPSSIEALADLPAQLADTSPREQAALYAANGIWQDALEIVAERYQTSPATPEAQQDWASLLGSIEWEMLDSDDDGTIAATAILESTVLDCCDFSLPDSEPLSDSD